MADRKDTGSAALGQYLASKRLSGGMSYRQMAARIGKAPSTIQSWEQGKRLPDLDDLLVLANVFDTDVNELVALAATPARDLKRRLAAAEDRRRKALRESSRADRGGNNRARSALTESGREAAFLQNLIAQRERLYQASKPQNMEPVHTPDMAGEVPGWSLRALPLYDLKKVPVVGGIRAGKPLLAVEETLGYTGAPRELDVDYALTVEGDSMAGAGIDPGDIVWVKQTDSADHGSTVVALLGGEEVTVKHLVREDGRYLLRANNLNRDYPDILLGPDDRIIGIVQRVVKRPGPPPK
ncbi:MAG: S24 family peptidase [Bacillota bacterium]